MRFSKSFWIDILHVYVINIRMFLYNVILLGAAPLHNGAKAKLM